MSFTLERAEAGLVMLMSRKRHFLGRSERSSQGIDTLESVQTIKWAASQEAVTIPWLSAHSIRKGIEGDTHNGTPTDPNVKDYLAGNFETRNSCAKPTERLTLNAPEC
jgi:hypothetical protein